MSVVAGAGDPCPRRATRCYAEPPGRLAQLGERQLDKLEVTGSSPVAPTSGKPRCGGVFALLVAPYGSLAPENEIEVAVATA